MYTKIEKHTARVQQVGDLFCVWLDENPDSAFFIRSCDYSLPAGRSRDYDWFANFPKDKKFHLFRKEVHPFYKEGGMFLPEIRSQYLDDSGKSPDFPMSFLQIPEGFDEKNVLHIDYPSHLIYEVGRKIPLSAPIAFSLHSGPGGFDVDAVEAHLRKDPRVTLYGRRTHDESCLFVVCFPQEEWDALYERYRGHRYPEMRIAECCEWPTPELGAEGNPDVLDLMQFYIPEEDEDENVD